MSSPEPAHETTVADPYLPGHGDPGYRVSRYDIDLDYRVATNRLAGRARVHATASTLLTRLALDLAALRVSKVLVNGRRPARWSHRSGKLSIWPETPVQPGEVLVVDVAYAGHPRPVVGTWGEVGWEELTDGVIVAGQPDGAPSWFPCNDHPGDKASYRIAVTTESAYRVVANGSLTERIAMAGRVRWVYDQPEPMSSYLASVQVGRYVTVPLPDPLVSAHAEVPSRLIAAFRRDFARHHELLALFTERFGPYPFSSYVVVVTDDALEIPLEAQGMSVFGANHVDGRGTHERLIAHELAHQWFGNSLTLGRWQDIWLHEGFAAYAEWLWSEHSGGPTASAMASAARARLARLPQDLVIGDPGPERMFDDRVYKRGALTLHALRLTLGDEPFFAALREWATGHAHQTVATAQFVETMQRHCPSRLDDLFTAWLSRESLPRLPWLAVGGRHPEAPPG